MPKISPLLVQQKIQERAQEYGLQSQDFERYKRQMILSEVGFMGQKQLKAARILVLGAGGLGSPCLLYLAAAGVGTLGIADFDVVDYSVKFSTDPLKSGNKKRSRQKIGF
jgi:adenylyltransferase/sulfurtransferase